MTVLTAVAVTGCAATQSSANGGSGASTSTASASTTGPSTGGASGTGSSLPSATPSASDSGSPVDARCPAQLDEGQYNGRQAKPIPSGIDVDWVLRCVVAPQPDGSRFLLVERSDSDPAALLAALRSPDEPASGGVCPMIRMVLPYFALVQRDGRALAPKVPLTGCRMAQAAVLQALNGMHFEVISRKRLP